MFVSNRIHLYNRRKMEKGVLMVKVIVIGGGILGASTAYHLAKKGAEVTIIDRQDDGQATAASAGIICPWLSQRRNKAWYSLAKAGAAYYPILVEELQRDGLTDIGYRKVGAISLHTEHKKLEKMLERGRMRKEDAPEIGELHLLSFEETKRKFPFVKDGYSSVFVEGAARVDGRKLRDSLIEAAKKVGAHVVYGSALPIVEECNIVAVEVNGCLYKADRFIVAAGAWANDFLETLNLKMKVSGQKAQIIHLFAENDQTEDWPVVMPPTDQYIVPFEGGKIVIGATHEDGKEFFTSPTAGGVHEVLDKALTVCPDLSNTVFEEVRTGFRPFTPNFLPVIGQLPNYPNAFISNGLGASGLTVGPFLGKQLSNIALQKEIDIDLSLYDVSQAFE